MISLHSVWEILKRYEHPSKETLDHLALLVGFQTWEELQNTLHEEKKINDADK